MQYRIMVISVSQSLIMKNSYDLQRKKKKVTVSVFYKWKEKVCDLVKIDLFCFHGWVEKGPFQPQQCGGESL